MEVTNYGLLGVGVVHLPVSQRKQLLVQYHIKVNGNLDFLIQKFGPPYLHPYACYREKLDGFCNGAAPRSGNTKNETNPISSYLISKPSRDNFFIKIESLVHQLFLISYLFDAVYRILDQVYFSNLPVCTLPLFLLPSIS